MAIIKGEGDGYVGLISGLDVGSRGMSVVEAGRTGQGAVELVYEAAPLEEVERRHHWNAVVKYPPAKKGTEGKLHEIET